MLISEQRLHTHPSYKLEAYHNQLTSFVLPSHLEMAHSGPGAGQLDLQKKQENVLEMQQLMTFQKNASSEEAKERR